MGCDLLTRFIQKYCKQSLDSITVRADAVFFDITAIQIGINQNYSKNAPELLSFLDIFIQYLQPTTLIFIAEEGVSPFQKSAMKKKLFLFNDDMSDIADNNEFMKLIQGKIHTDPAWRTPKVIFSSIQTPGEAEHKIFSFLKSFNKKNNITRESNFINFIVSCDSDVIHLSLANHLYNTFVVTNLKLTELRASSGPLPLNQEDDYFDPKRNAESFNVINMRLLSEIIYCQMTGELEEPSNEELEKTMNDFELMCMLRKNDFVYHNGFDYKYIPLYANLYIKGLHLIENNAINNLALAEFIELLIKNDACVIKYTLEEAQKQIDLISWCYQYYQQNNTDFAFCFRMQHNGKNEDRLITLADFLRKNSHYKKEFDTLIPSCIQRAAFKGFRLKSEYPQEIKSAISGLEVKEDFSNLKEILNIIEEASKKCKEEELKPYEKRKPYVIEKDRMVPYSFNLVAPKKSKPFFIDSLWSFDVDFEFGTGDKYNLLFLKETEQVSVEDAVKMIGEEVIIKWPQVQIAKICKIIVGDTMIDEDHSVRKIPPDYIKENIEENLFNDKTMLVENQQKAYAYVKQLVTLSNSRRIYGYRSYYKVVPFSTVIKIDKDHPIHRNYQPDDDSYKLAVGDRVFVPKLEAAGVIKEMKEGDDEYVIHCEISNHPEYNFVSDDSYGYISKKRVAKKMFNNDVKIFDYFFEKAGFKSTYFKCGRHFVPKSVIHFISCLMTKNYDDHDSYNDVNEGDFEYSVIEDCDDKFSTKDLISIGSDIRKVNMPIRINSRVAFIGRSSSVPFGMTGTVCKKMNWKMEALVIADKPFDFGIKLKYGERKLFDAFIGDLYVIKY